MKRLIFFTVIALTMFCGCSFRHTVNVPPECTESVLYKFAPWSFVTLTAGQAAARQYMSAQDYELAARSAHLLADQLESGIDWTKIKSIPDWSRIVAAEVLPLLLDRDRIDRCDRVYLIGYLRSW